MSAEEVLYATLDGDPGVTAIIAGRIYPDILPEEEELPAVVYQRSNTEDIVTLGGVVAATVSTIEVGCLASKRADAEALANVVLPVLMAAGMVQLNRQSGFDPDNLTYAVQLTVRHSA